MELIGDISQLGDALLGRSPDEVLDVASCHPLGEFLLAEHGNHTRSVVFVSLNVLEVTIVRLVVPRGTVCVLGNIDMPPRSDRQVQPKWLEALLTGPVNGLLVPCPDLIEHLPDWGLAGGACYDKANPS
jgi:hypothetical protein